MLKPAAAVQQPSRAPFRFALELGPPVAEPLQRQAVQLAVFPLVEPAPRPLIMVETPKRLEFHMLPPAHTPHLRCSITMFTGTEAIETAPQAASVHSLYAYPQSLISADEFPDTAE